MGLIDEPALQLDIVFRLKPDLIVGHPAHLRVPIPRRVVPDILDRLIRNVQQHLLGNVDYYKQRHEKYQKEEHDLEEELSPSRRSVDFHHLHFKLIIIFRLNFHILTLIFFNDLNLLIKLIWALELFLFHFEHLW